MKTLDSITSKFKEPLDERIIEFLECVVEGIDDKHLKSYSKLILKMLIPQLILYYKALDLMEQNKSVRHEDIYNRITKAPEVQVLQKANDQILNLLDKLALSPIEKAKIKRLNKDEGEDAKKLLEDLIS